MISTHLAGQPPVRRALLLAATFVALFLMLDVVWGVDACEGKRDPKPSKRKWTADVAVVTTHRG